jgi:kynurenine formamidase
MMLTSGDALGEKAIPGYQETNDYLGIACHGLATTHIDALCHVFIDGRMYNGYGREYVRTTGAERNSIGGAAGGIVGRGVLMDIPRLRGTEWLDPGDAITPEELDAAATEQQTPVRQGDILIVSTGRQERRASEGERRHYRSGLAGLHPECLIWLHQRSVAVLGSDGVSDPAPNNAAEGWPVPIHQCGISGMGLHLIDNMALAELAAVCARLGQWDFLFAIAPLRAQGATASPVNPLAVL